MDWIRGRGNEYIITAQGEGERERKRKIFEENVIKKFLFVYSYRRYYVYPPLMNTDILGLRNFENYYLCIRVKTVHFFMNTSLHKVKKCGFITNIINCVPTPAPPERNSKLVEIDTHYRYP
jgi:hypothetical protein